MFVFFDEPLRKNNKSNAKLRARVGGNDVVLTKFSPRKKARVFQAPSYKLWTLEATGPNGSHHHWIWVQKGKPARAERAPQPAPDSVVSAPPPARTSVAPPPALPVPAILSVPAVVPMGPAVAQPKISDQALLDLVDGVSLLSPLPSPRAYPASPTADDVWNANLERWFGDV